MFHIIIICDYLGNYDHTRKNIKMIKSPPYPGFVTTSLSTLTASSFDMFSKLVSLTCNIISPGSIRPSRATAPPAIRKHFKVKFSYKIEES